MFAGFQARSPQPIKRPAVAIEQVDDKMQRQINHSRSEPGQSYTSSFVSRDCSFVSGRMESGFCSFTDENREVSVSASIEASAEAGAEACGSAGAEAGDSAGAEGGSSSTSVLTKVDEDLSEEQQAEINDQLKEFTSSEGW